MGSLKNNARRLRADGELGDEEDLERRKKDDDRYYRGIYAAKPEHFAEAWPTVRTETFVRMVFGSIQKREGATYDEIVDDTSLDEDVVGKCLAELMVGQKTVATRGDEDWRVYFVK